MKSTRKSKRTPARERRFTVAKLAREEHDLLRDLAKNGGVADRHTAFLELVPIVEGLTEIDLALPPLDPIRLGIPASLDKALRDKKAELNKPFIRLLLIAARKWLDAKNPRQPEI
jgi:hypothetical protein